MGTTGRALIEYAALWKNMGNSVVRKMFSLPQQHHLLHFKKIPASHSEHVGA